MSFLKNQHVSVIDHQVFEKKELDLEIRPSFEKFAFFQDLYNVFYTPFYFGSENSGWSTLIDELINVPEFDVSNIMKMFENIQLVFEIPDMEIKFVLPATITLGVLALQYSTEFVRWLFDRYSSH